MFFEDEQHPYFTRHSGTVNAIIPPPTQKSTHHRLLVGANFLACIQMVCKRVKMLQWPLIRRQFGEHSPDFIYLLG